MATLSQGFRDFRGSGLNLITWGLMEHNHRPLVMGDSGVSVQDSRLTRREINELM